MFNSSCRPIQTDFQLIHLRTERSRSRTRLLLAASVVCLCSNYASALEFSNKDGQHIAVEMTTAEAVSRAADLKAAGYIIRWFDVQHFVGNKLPGSSRAAMKGTYWSFIAGKNIKNVDWLLVPDIERSKASSMIASYRNNGYRLKQIETLEGTNYVFLMIKETGNASQATVNVSKSHHQHLFNNLTSQGYGLVQGGCKKAPSPGNEVADDERYALYEKDGYSTWSRHSLARLNMRSLFDFKASQGYYLADLDVFHGQTIPYYVNGMAKPAANSSSGEGAFGMVFKKGKYGSKGALKTNMSADALIAKHNQIAPDGYVMTMCVGYRTGSGVSPVYAALWRKPSRVPPSPTGPTRNPVPPSPGRPAGPGGFRPTPRDNDPNAIPPRPVKTTRNPRIPQGPGGFRPTPKANDLDAIPPRPVKPTRNPRIPQGPGGFRPAPKNNDLDAIPPRSIRPIRNPRIPTRPGRLSSTLRTDDLDPIPRLRFAPRQNRVVPATSAERVGSQRNGQALPGSPKGSAGRTLNTARKPIRRTHREAAN
jgi:hypothetical protein